jgi:catechol 2,3-dioxygenase-like lactoylglutathione lyase family enzyme
VPFALDHLIIAVADLDAAVRDWTDLLGRSVSWRGSHPALGTANALFRFGGCYLELLAADPAREGLLGTMVRDVLDDRGERPSRAAALAFLKARGVLVRQSASAPRRF